MRLFQQPGKEGTRSFRLWKEKRAGRSGGLGEGQKALPKPLMRSSLIEGQNRGACGGGRGASHGGSGSDPGMLPLTLIENALTDSMGSWRTVGVRSTLMPLVAATRATFGPN